jgi:hypothetical protein
MTTIAHTTTARLTRGDVFRFGTGTLLEKVMTFEPALADLFVKSTKNARKRGADQVEQYFDPQETAYVVIGAGPTTGGDCMGREDDNGGWRVTAAPKGTALEELAEQSVTFIQFGPYKETAMPDVILVKKAKEPVARTTAIRR